MTSHFTQVTQGGEVQKDAYARPEVTVPTVHDATLRQTLHITRGGQQVRVRLSNYFGTTPLTITAAHLARHAAGSADLSAIDTASDHVLRFHGRSSVTIAPGQQVVSDPVPLAVKPLSDVTLSLYARGAMALSSMHPMEHDKPATLVTGNAVAAASLKGKHGVADAPKDVREHVYVVTGIEVAAPAHARAVIAFGDSITDGAYATAPDKPWPDQLASVAHEQGKALAVGNAGISADELTVDQVGCPGCGVSGLKRFLRDVVDRPGVTDVIVMLGTNDLNRGAGPAGFPTGASAPDIVAGLRMLADVAHQHHLRIYAATLTPIAGFSEPNWYSPEHEAVRIKVNQWIRHNHVFDGTVDFAKAVTGPYKPSPLAARQSPLPPGMANACAGDPGLHPNDRGYRAMAVAAYDALYQVYQAQLKPAHPCQ
ncbi:GDSL-type esterase/lipase family protein [Oleiagrimonas sp. C23AA]|uniref:GDSL-type esterase/lipase family protein n=1 Tax=Oleiagrimonas sp. C23AA TaxID=2719047 RepID=UPI00141E8AC2|nr:GDSL-type esterase/lipase family protein [Oleiagrimonas sp. C23AA]NII09718.1 GDSL family lipase [Oleiagrimonas sp. C23AA]